MTFTLIKNELIKLLKKGKTWIVFGLFILFIGITVFSQYREDATTRQYMTIESKLESAKYNLDYINSEIEGLKEFKDANPAYVESLNASKAEAEEKIKTYEEMVAKGVTSEDLWKQELEENIANTESYLEETKDYDDEWSLQYREQSKAELEELKYLRDNNIRPLYNWEYQGYGYMKNISQFLGMAILLCGIAVFMSDIVSGECTPATLKFLLVQPVTRGKVLFSKFIAVVITVLTMILGSEILGFLFIKLTGTIDGGNYPITIGTLYQTIINENGNATVSAISGTGQMVTNSEFLIRGLLFQALFIFTGCTVIFMISTLIKSSMITMALSVISTVFITIGTMNIAALRKLSHFIFVNYGDALGVFTGETVMMYQNSNMSIKTGIIVMVVTSVVAYTIAHINFSRKDILI